MTLSKKPRAGGYLAATTYWVDTRIGKVRGDAFVPFDLSALLGPHGIDGAAFGARIGPLLGTYRGSQSTGALRPTRAEEIAALAAFQKSLRDVVAAFGPTGLPPIASAKIHEIAYTRGRRNWFELGRVVTDLLMDADAFAGIVRREFEKLPPISGRKANFKRDVLALAVIQELEEDGVDGVELRRDLARQILLGCGVPVPDDLKQAVNKVQKRIRKGA